MESIIAPRGATGQGGRERHRLKGQRLKRKQEGQIMKEAQGWTTLIHIFLSKKGFDCRPEQTSLMNAMVFAVGQASAEALRCTGLPAANPPCWPG
ncbi:hypothetical protein JOQ06_018716 [Pogonophryne albipinna]|uniref:Uncharacterized protein n=1 Tax=Pogonophryne albipinna TaxID=1090488 RepID=A0AAD6ARY1_9TELE|nr:hypothetical protein JOQ06_018716 [Pogonophryne albipinna]